MALPTASDNVFTRFLISEGGSTTTPASGRVTVYAKADGLLYQKDDAGTETGLAVGSGAVATDAIWDAAGDLAVGTGANTAARLALGTSGYVPKSNGTTVAWGAAPLYHGCRITEGTAQSVADDTDAAMTSNDAEIYDPDGWHDTSSDTSRITPTIAGLYDFKAECFFTADADGYRQVQLFKNGTTQIGLVRIPVSSGTNATEIICAADTLMNGTTDYVEARVKHTAGGALNVYLSYFSAHLIGTT